MAVNINLTSGKKADRKLDMIFVNVGTSSAPDWELQGRGIEDAAVEFSHDVEQTTDILGITDTTVSAAKPEMTFDAYTIRGGQKLTAKLLDYERESDVGSMGLFEILHVHCFLGEGTDGPFTAEKHTGCTIVPTSLGGSDYVDMGLEMHLSNDKTLGTATITNGEVSFTASK